MPPARRRAGGRERVHGRGHGRQRAAAAGAARGEHGAPARQRPQHAAAPGRLLVLQLPAGGRRVPRALPVRARPHDRSGRLARARTGGLACARRAFNSPPLRAGRLCGCHLHAPTRACLRPACARSAPCAHLREVRPSGMNAWVHHTEKGAAHGSGYSLQPSAGVRMESCVTAGIPVSLHTHQYHPCPPAAPWQAAPAARSGAAERGGGHGRVGAGGGAAGRGRGGRGAAFWQLGALEVQHIWTSASAIKRAYCMALFTLLAPACARRALCQAPTKGLYLGQFSVT